MRCPNCNDPIRFVVKMDINDAIEYVFDGLVDDGYVPHRDEVEVLLYHAIDYFMRVGLLDHDSFNGHGSGI